MKKENEQINDGTMIQKPAFRCTTILGNDVIVKCENVEEMVYNPAAKIAQFFTRHQHLVIPMERDQFELIAAACTSGKMPEIENNK